MSNDSPDKMPVNIASEPWVMEKLMDTENRIERAFHEQTRYLTQQQESANQKLDETIRLGNEALRRTNEKVDQSQRWMIGLIITIVITLIAGMFFQHFG